MKYVVLLFVILTFPAGASATAGPDCGSHWCMLVIGPNESGHACMVGGEMGPNTCVATTSGCSRMACRYSVLLGTGGRLLALVTPHCGEQPRRSVVWGTPTAVLPTLTPGILPAAVDRLDESEGD